MLENCPDLRACEETLSVRVARVKLLGEIPLLPGDLEKLETLIAQSFRLGVCTLAKIAPHSLACYLVGKGIYHYESETGDYWSSIRDALDISAAIQNELGSFFVAYLERNDHLLSLDTPGAHAFVGPILFHGLIPDSCLDDYFEWFSSWTARSGLRGVSDRELSHELQLMRDNRTRWEDETAAVENLRTRQKATRARVNLLRDLLSNWDELEGLKEKQGQLDRLAGKIPDLPDDPARYIGAREAQAEELADEIRRLREDAAQLEASRAAFDRSHRQILPLEADILDLQSRLPELRVLRCEIERQAECNGQLQRQLHGAAGADGRFCEKHLLSEADLGELEARAERLGMLDEQMEALSANRYIPLCLAAGLGLLAGTVLSPVIGGMGVLVTLWSAWKVPAWQRSRRTREEHDNLLSDLDRRLKPLPGRLRETPIAEALHRLRSALETHGSLQEGMDALEELRGRLGVVQEEVAETARAAGLEPAESATAEQMIEHMAAHLLDAESRSQIAATADRRLQEQVGPRLHELQRRRAVLLREKEAVHSQVSTIGDGDFVGGLEVLRAFRQDSSLVDELRGRLDDRLIALHRRQTGAGKGRSDIASEVQDGLAQMRSLEDDLQAKRHWLTTYSCPLRHRSHPVQRFILGGETVAERFLQETHRLVGGEAPTPALPPRVVKEFALQNRLASPRIRFLPETAQIAALFPAQRFRGRSETPGVRLHLSAGDHSLAIPLEVFREGSLLVTEECTISLPPGASPYAFSLRDERGELAGWELSVSAPWAAFSHPDGRYLREDLAPERMWMVLPGDWSPVRPRVIAEGALSGEWSGYHYYDIDAADAEVVELEGTGGEMHTIPLVQGRDRAAVQLRGGSKLEGIRCESEPVYTEETPHLQIPAADPEDLNLWDLSIIPSGDSPVTLSPAQLVEEGRGSYCPEGGAARIPLKPWTDPHLLERFRVRIHRGGQWVDTLGFCTAGGLGFEFDEPLYVPASSREAYGLKITTDERLTVELADRTEVREVHRDSGRTVMDVGVNRSQGTVNGLLRWEDREFPFAISVPRIRWGLKGSDEDDVSWRDTTEELWGNDLDGATVFVQLPASISGRARLTLREARQALAERLLDGRGEFELSAFADSLREADAPVVGFDLSVSRADSPALRDGTEIFSVRTRWEAKHLRCVQVDEGTATVLQVSWDEEAGRADRRVVRLWHRRSEKLVTEVPVERGLQEMVLDLQGSISPGEYRVEAAALEDDEWGALPPEARYPTDGSPSALDVRIRPPEELATGDCIEMRAVHPGRRGAGEHVLEPTYSIRVLGRIINQNTPVEDLGGEIRQKHEGWYVGELSVHGRAYAGFQQPANAVKLEIADGWITAAEDADGDGAIFCRACKLLFWAQEDQQKEMLRGHSSSLQIHDLYIAYAK